MKEKVIFRDVKSIVKIKRPFKLILQSATFLVSSVILGWSCVGLVRLPPTGSRNGLPSDEPIKPFYPSLFLSFNLSIYSYMMN